MGGTVEGKVQKLEGYRVWEGMEGEVQRKRVREGIGG